MIDFIDDHRDVYGVGPICKVLPIAPSTYHETQLRQADPVRRPVRQQRDAKVCEAVHDRRPAQGLIQHTDRGVQYLSIRYSERLADIGIKPSVGRVGSSYDCQSLCAGFRKNQVVLVGAV